MWVSSNTSLNLRIYLVRSHFSLWCILGHWRMLLQIVELEDFPIRRIRRNIWHCDLSSFSCIPLSTGRMHMLASSFGLINTLYNCDAACRGSPPRFIPIPSNFSAALFASSVLLRINSLWFIPFLVISTPRYLNESVEGITWLWIESWFPVPLILSHLDALNWYLFFSACLVQMSSSSCSFQCSSANSAISSAYMVQFISTLPTLTRCDPFSSLARSSMNIEYRHGLRTDPCNKPDSIWNGLDFLPLITTWEELWSNICFSIPTTFGSIPRFRQRLQSILLSTES